MPSFSFDVEDVLDLGNGFTGITLIGPLVETSGGLAVGDTLLVPVNAGGQASCECVEFLQHLPSLARLDALCRE